MEIMFRFRKATSKAKKQAKTMNFGTQTISILKVLKAKYIHSPLGGTGEGKNFKFSIENGKKLKKGLKLEIFKLD